MTFVGQLNICCFARFLLMSLKSLWRTHMFAQQKANQDTAQDSFTAKFQVGISAYDKAGTLEKEQFQLVSFFERYLSKFFQKSAGEMPQLVPWRSSSKYHRTKNAFINSLSSSCSSILQLSLIIYHTLLVGTESLAKLVIQPCIKAAIYL